MFFLLGMTIGAVFFISTLRFTVFKRQSDAKGYKASALIAVLFASVLSGIGGADGGAFNVGASATAMIFYSAIGIAITILVRKRTEPPVEKKKSTILSVAINFVLWIVLVFFVCIPTIGAFLALSTNPSMFDWKTINGQFDLPCNELGGNPLQIACDKSGLKQVNKEMNLGLPKMIDSITRLDSVSVFNDRIEYSHVILDPNFILTNAALDMFAENISQNLCSSVSSSSDQSKLIYDYERSTGEFIMRVDVDITLCGSDKAYTVTR